MRALALAAVLLPLLAGCSAVAKDVPGTTLLFSSERVMRAQPAAPPVRTAELCALGLEYARCGP